MLLSITSVHLIGHASQKKTEKEKLIKKLIVPTTVFLRAFDEHTILLPTLLLLVLYY